MFAKLYNEPVQIINTKSTIKILTNLYPWIGDSGIEPAAGSSDTSL